MACDVINKPLHGLEMLQHRNADPESSVMQFDLSGPICDLTWRDICCRGLPDDYSPVATWLAHTETRMNVIFPRWTHFMGFRALVSTAN